MEKEHFMMEMKHLKLLSKMEIWWKIKLLFKYQLSLLINDLKFVLNQLIIELKELINLFNKLKN